MNAVFLDTVGLIALWDPSDQWHPAATKAFAQIVKDRINLVSSTCVFLECGNAASRKPYRVAVNRLRRELAGQQTLIDPTLEDVRDAWATYHGSPVGSAGIVDLISFRIMSRLNITDAFTNDQHFRAAGFHTAF